MSKTSKDMPNKEEIPKYGPRTRRRKIEEEREKEVVIPSRAHLEDLYELGRRFELMDLEEEYPPYET